MKLKTLFFSLLIIASNFGMANERPNFICKTNRNAAGMYLKANVYTMFYSRKVKTDLFHVSTYREEAITSQTVTPDLMARGEIKIKLAPKSDFNWNRPGTPFQGEDFFIPLPGVPGFGGGSHLGVHLLQQSTSVWTGLFELYGRTTSGKEVLRKYKMNCVKL